MHRGYRVHCASPVTFLLSTATQKIICSQSIRENTKQPVPISFLQYPDLLDPLFSPFPFSYIAQQLLSASLCWNTVRVNNRYISQQSQPLPLNTHTTDFSTQHFGRLFIEEHIHSEMGYRTYKSYYTMWWQGKTAEHSLLNSKILELKSFFFQVRKTQRFLHFKCTLITGIILMGNGQDNILYKKKDKNVFSNVFLKVLKELGAQMLQDGISRSCELHFKSQLQCP